MARLVSLLVPLIRVNVVSFLLLCYLLLVLLGGAVFTAVERPVEEELRAEVEELRRSFLQENPCVEESGLRELLRKVLSAHRSDVAVLKADADDRRYDFTSSLYFVIATLTTKSPEAKLFCILYCSLGIPLTLFLLTLLSSLLLHVVTHRPLHHLHTYWGLPSTQAALPHACLLFVLLLCFLLLLPALLVCVVEPSWSFLDALFYCFITLSTVGQGGDSLGRSWSPVAKERLELFTTCYLLLGLVVIITFKDTVLQVPQLRALLRLLSGPRYRELEGLHLNELPHSEEQCEEEEEQKYCQSICTISSTPLEQRSPEAKLSRIVQ